MTHTESDHHTFEGPADGAVAAADPAAPNGAVDVDGRKIEGCDAIIQVDLTGCVWTGLSERIGRT